MEIVEGKGEGEEGNKCEQVFMWFLVSRGLAWIRHTWPLLGAVESEKCLIDKEIARWKKIMRLRIIN